jgi:hypothetical protein
MGEAIWNATKPASDTTTGKLESSEITNAAGGAWAA